ncbi:MAG: ABC transporter substrate-binding protein, partial [Alphaproteobacteria bacterium]|nr:ABC transporter substrate-binding protein [Alphaproteobacteria bacterium]
MHKLIRVLFCCVLCMMALGPAEAARDSLVIGMRLEPPGLDPTTGAAEAIGEITLYNIFEGLTRIDQNGSVGPGLATAWQVSQDQLSYSFTLRSGVVFSDGTAFDSSDVKFSFERAASATSTNKRKAWFTNIAAIATPDPTTVTITLRDKNPAFLFNLGESPAVIMAPESAAGAATLPIGTGPYRLETWVKGDSVTLARNPAYRDPDAIRLSKVTFRFIDDSSAQITAMLSGDLDCFPFFDSPESVPLFAADPRFAVMEGTTEGETILAMNNKRPPLDDVRVRRAISLAIDRAALIEGAMFGRATPIGSHFAPHHPDYIDQTGVSPF